MLANPPFGVEWKKVADAIKTEAETLGFAGRFGAGLPRINDGSFLFLQHMLSKMKPVEEGGSRLAIVFNGSPLFTGGAGSGESEIRRWIIENDWLEAIVALPDQLFYNTGISTYFWVLTNRKRPERQGKVQLVDAREFFTKMRKSLGEKRKEISADADRGDHPPLRRVRGERARSKVFRNEQFGYQRITVERPLRLRYAVTDETRRPRSPSSKAYAKLAPDDQERLTRRPDGAQRPLHHRPKEALAAFAARAREASTSRREKAILDAIAVRDPDAPVDHEEGQARTRPRPPRQRERPAPRRRRSATKPTRPPARLSRRTASRRGVRRGRGAALRARRLGRPHQDQDRLRDPAHAALLPLRAASAARGDRRRDQAA